MTETIAVPTQNCRWISFSCEQILRKRPQVIRERSRNLQFLFISQKWGTGSFVAIRRFLREVLTLNPGDPTDPLQTRGLSHTGISNIDLLCALSSRNFASQHNLLAMKIGTYVCSASVDLWEGSPPEIKYRFCTVTVVAHFSVTLFG